MRLYKMRGVTFMQQEMNTWQKQLLAAGKAFIPLIEELPTRLVGLRATEIECELRVQVLQALHEIANDDKE